MRVHYLQHAPLEDPGFILQWAESRGIEVGKSLLHENDHLPSPGDFDLLVVMGGPMNIYEEGRFPWLRPEKECIRRAIDAGKGVLGICLGAQLLADTLGGSVEKGNDKEIGWFEVSLARENARGSDLFNSFPDQFTAFHWHGDVIRLPDRASLIATSEACPVQAFQFGGRPIAGLQFHIELTRENIEQWIQSSADEFVPGKFIQQPEEIRKGFKHLAPMHSLAGGLLDNLRRMLP